MNNLQFNDPKHKLFALYYGISALVGIWVLTLQAIDASLSWLILVLYLILYAQLMLMLLGAYHYWNRDAKGLKILFWVSLSLVFMLMTPLIIYIPRITPSFFIYFHMNDMSSGFGFDFHLFYDSALRILPASIWGFGMNIIEFFIFLRFKRVAEEQNISMACWKSSSHS